MKRSLFALALAAALPLSAQADDKLSYTYVEGGWTQVKTDDDVFNDPKVDGGYVRGSIALAEQVHVFGGWNYGSKSYDYDYGSMKLKLNQPELGIGYHMPFSDRVDYTADIKDGPLDHGFDHQIGLRKRLVVGGCGKASQDVGLAFLVGAGQVGQGLAHGAGVQRRDHRIADQQHVPAGREAGDQRAVVEQAAADVDGVGARAEFDRQHEAIHHAASARCQAGSSRSARRSQAVATVRPSASKARSAMPA